MNEPKVGGQSPWGGIDGIEKLADGIVFVSTPSHGGAWLSPARLKEMRPALLTPTRFYQAGSPWFEEDCEILRVVVSFPALFKTPYAQAVELLCKSNAAVRDALTQEAVRGWAGL